MQKIKKYLLCLIACCLAFVCAFGAACSEGGSDGDGGSDGSENSEEENTENNDKNDDNNEEEEDYTLTSTKVYFVGDSTVCEFSDSYYLPRYGYGTQFSNYINSSYVSVTNLALSGRSSRSYILEDEYQTLKTSLKEGDYLIIGFGHNDEKEETEEDHRYTSPETNAVDTEGSFQYYLYNYYIKIAQDIGATPILCTPIVRANASDNYEGSSGHVTSNGDYAACIRDLAEDQGITCVDLTAQTKTLYEDIGYSEAIYYHSWRKTSSKSVDTTHLNIYGAKNVAYMLATTLRTNRKTCNLGYYVLSDITAPTKDNDLVPNAEYVEPEYYGFDPSTDTSSTYTSITSDGWYGTAFIAADSSSNVKKFTVAETTSTTGLSFNVGETGNVGKIESGQDSIAMAFRQVSLDDNFTITATATITSVASSVTQGAFGIMLRDDIYIDAYNTSISSNYVTAGAYVSSSGSQFLYYRENGALKTTGYKASAFTASEVYYLTITRSGQSVTTTIKLSDNTTYSKTHVDFDFTEMDTEYFYVGLFAARCLVSYSNVVYTYTGVAEQA